MNKVMDFSTVMAIEGMLVRIPWHIRYCLNILAKLRNDSIPGRVRNISHYVKSAHEAHFLGALAEYAFSVLANIPMDTNIYRGRGDPGSDFGCIEVKGVRYPGPKIDFKMKPGELNRKKDGMTAIVLCRVAKNYDWVKVLAGLSKEKFLERAERRKYTPRGNPDANRPLNYVVRYDESLPVRSRKMTMLTPENISTFVEQFYRPHAEAMC